MTTSGCVQECGCIALPEELQQQTGLYSGAKFQLELREDGSLLLIPKEPSSAQASRPGIKCEQQ